MASFDQLLVGLDCKNDFEASEVQGMEMRLLEALDWNISLPSSYEISNYLIDTCLRGQDYRTSKTIIAKANTLCKTLLLGKPYDLRHQDMHFQSI